MWNIIIMHNAILKSDPESMLVPRPAIKLRVSEICPMWDFMNINLPFFKLPYKETLEGRCNNISKI